MTTPERASAALSDLYNKPMQYRSAAATYEPGIAQVLNDRYATMLATLSAGELVRNGGLHRERMMEFAYAFRSDRGDINAMRDRIEDEIPTMPPGLAVRIGPWGDWRASVLHDAAGTVVPVDPSIPDERPIEEIGPVDDLTLESLREWMALSQTASTMGPCSTSLHALHHDTSTRPVASRVNPSPPSP